MLRSVDSTDPICMSCMVGLVEYHLIHDLYLAKIKQSKLKNMLMYFKDVKPRRFSKNVLESINIGHFQKISSRLILKTNCDIHHFQQTSCCTLEVEDQPQPGWEGRAAGGEEVNCLRAAPTILGLGAIPVSTSIRSSRIRFRDLRDWPEGGAEP